jgi:hypothetical protein
MKIAYEDWAPRAQSMETIDTANGIIEEYSRDGYTLTLRQLYYQFVAKDLIENSERSYKNLGNLVTKARMSGLMSWHAIEDRNRSSQSWLICEDEAEVLSGIEYGIGFDFWDRQDVYVEVWVEKDALGSVIERPCRRWRVPYMACKGYLSASEAWRAGRRFMHMHDKGQKCVMIHLGDHDPSGLDMTRDNDDRLAMFAETPVEVRRIALNFDQIEEYSPPPNPTKVTDSRADSYISEFGHTSWELDALNPRTIGQLIEGQLEELIDRDIWERTQEEEEASRERLRYLGDNWEDVAFYIDDALQDSDRSF